MSVTRKDVAEYHRSATSVYFETELMIHPYVIDERLW